MSLQPFELITDDEVLYQMCQGWDTETLLNMSEAYSRVYQVCEKEIKKRKKQYIAGRIDKDVSEIHKAALSLQKFNIGYRKMLPNGVESSILFTEYHTPYKIIVSEDLHYPADVNVSNLKPLSGILPDVQPFIYPYSGNIISIKQHIIATKDIRDIAKPIIERLYQEGYQKSIT